MAVIDYYPFGSSTLPNIEQNIVGRPAVIICAIEQFSRKRIQLQFNEGYVTMQYANAKHNVITNAKDNVITTRLLMIDHTHVFVCISTKFYGFRKCDV